MPEPGALSSGQAALVALAAAIASRDEPSLRTALLHAAEYAPHAEVDEVILQSHLFVGFPDALNALALWRELSGSVPLARRPEPSPLWEERGTQVCRKVYGGNYERLRAYVAALHPDLDRWMVVGGYGRVIGRPGLDLPTRELCITALLAVWNTPRQLHSHLRGALNAGATPRQVEAALAIACRHLDPSRAARVQALWAEVRK